MFHENESSSVLKRELNYENFHSKTWPCLFTKTSFFFKQKTAYEIASCLVGSEMCIRDSTIIKHVFMFVFQRSAHFNVYLIRFVKKLKTFYSIKNFNYLSRFRNSIKDFDLHVFYFITVSYTHLTLPTILLV